MKDNKRKKIKIPSIFVVIIQGPYKGQEAEVRSRIGRGELLNIAIAATGNCIILPVTSVLFRLQGGATAKYTQLNDGNLRLTGVDLGNGDLNIKVEDALDFRESSKEFYEEAPIFFADSSHVNIETDNDSEDEFEGNYDEGLEGPEGLEELEDSTKYTSNNVLDNYAYFNSQSNRETVDLYNNSLASTLSTLFNLLGFNLDNVSINNHFLRLEKALNDLESQRSFDVDTYYSTAYIFIHVNNMGIGYPVIFQDCKQTPNDDPTFITCILKKSGIVKVPDHFKLDQFIQNLLDVLETKIVPSFKNTGINDVVKKFSILTTDSKKIEQSLKYPESKPMKLMRYRYFSNPHVYEVAKSMTLSKIRNSISQEKDEKVIKSLSLLMDQFDTFIKGEKRLILKSNPKSFQSKLLLPYLSFYDSYLKLKEEEFYNNPIKSVIKKVSSTKNTTNHLPIDSSKVSEKIIDMIETVASNTKNMEKKKILEKIHEMLINDYFWDIGSFMNSEYYDKMYENYISDKGSIEFEYISPYLFKYQAIINSKNDGGGVITPPLKDLSIRHSENIRMKKYIHDTLKSELLVILKKTNNEEAKKITTYISKNLEHIIKIPYSKIKSMKLELTLEKGYNAQLMKNIIDTNLRFYSTLEKFKKKEHLDKLNASAYKIITKLKEEKANNKRKKSSDHVEFDSKKSKK